MSDTGDSKERSGQFAEAMLEWFTSNLSNPSSSLRPLLELQRSVLEHYKEMLEQATGDSDRAEQRREATKALMELYFETLQSTRTFRDELLKAHTNFVLRYAELLDQLIERRGDPKS